MNELDKILDETIFDHMQIMNNQECSECRIDRIKHKADAKSALIQYFKDLLPEKIKKVPHSESQKKLLHYAEGYNQAISDIEQSLKEKDK